jgi:hypothetical protein
MGMATGIRKKTEPFYDYEVMGAIRGVFRGLSGAEQRFLLALSYSLDFGTHKGYPKMETLAKAAGASVSTMQRARSALERKGYLKVSFRYRPGSNAEQGANLYEVILDPRRHATVAAENNRMLARRTGKMAAAKARAVWGQCAKWLMYFAALEKLKEDQGNAQSRKPSGNQHSRQGFAALVSGMAGRLRGLSGAMRTHGCRPRNSQFCDPSGSKMTGQITNQYIMGSMEKKE